MRSWYFEVWNEPNLDGFWGEGRPERPTSTSTPAKIIKDHRPGAAVGGLSTAGAAWCRSSCKRMPRRRTARWTHHHHTYGVGMASLDEFGVEDRMLSPNPDAIVGDVPRAREQIEASHLPGLPLFFTEMEHQLYNPRDKVHDSYMSAPMCSQAQRPRKALAQPP